MLEERRLNLEVVDASIKIKINEICLDHLNMDESKFIINRIETGRSEERRNHSFNKGDFFWSLRPMFFNYSKC